GSDARDELERHAQRELGVGAEHPIVPREGRTARGEVLGLGIDVDDRNADGPRAGTELLVGIGEPAGTARLYELEPGAAGSAERHDGAAAAPFVAHRDR